jgi:2-oxo-4-hydroxy-4-carboxy-5-ureidoimidazoline decarboxylase
VTLEEFDRLPIAEARAALARCCGSQGWVEAMVARRPFGRRRFLFGIAERVWRALPADAWREAFEHHPRIGDLAALRERFAGAADLAGREQSQVARASEETLAALAEGNRLYEERFGYIFLVFASGRGADELLHLLRSRLGNDPEREIAIAAGEQMKITRLRLDRLIVEGGPSMGEGR